MPKRDSSGSAEAVLSQMSWLRALCRSLVSDAQTADDVVQDTWVAALERRPEDLEGGRLRGWLRTVARNAARRRHRDESVRKHHEARHAEDHVGPTTEQVERLQLQRLVADQVLELREPYRTAVLLRFQDGLSYARIAKLQGIRQEAARQRVSRGLAQLRERLDRRHSGDRAAWCTLLAPLVDQSGLGPLGTGLTLGGIAMGTKTAIAAGVVVAAACLYVITDSNRNPEAAAPDERAESVAQVELNAPATVDAAPPAAREMLVVESSEPVAEPEVGALATADPDRDLHGRIVDVAGDPIPGAKILIQRDDLREYSDLDVHRDKTGVNVDELVSDGFGEFAIPLDRGRPFFVRVEKPGYATAMRQDRYAGEYLEICLLEPAAFEGRVVDASGRGVPSRIEGRVRKVGYFNVIEGRTGADGRFRFEGLEPGEVTIELHPEGAAPPPWKNIRLVAGETTEHEFVCSSGFLVRGRVTDAETGAPIAGAEVSEGWTFDRYVTTNRAGEFELEHFPESGVPDVVVRAEGYGRLEKNLTEGVDGVVTVDFELEPARRALGQIVDPAGQPVADAYVVAVTSHFTGTKQRTDWRPARSASDGHFELTDLRSDERHALYVVADGFATAIYDFPENEMHVTTVDLGKVPLELPYELRGVVVGSDGTPLSDCYVELSGVNESRGLLGGSPVTGIDTYCGQREGRTDHLGRFAFVDLSPAEYKLGARRSDSPWTHQTHRVGNGPRIVDVRVQLFEGESISGVVLAPNGDPLGGVAVMLQPKAGTEGRPGHKITGADGSFRVAGLSPGLYQLDAFPTDLATEGRPPMLSTVLDVETGTPPLEVHLRAAATIRGHVFDHEGRAVLKATVRALDDEGLIESLAMTEADGSFELSLEAGLDVDLLATPAPEAGPAYNFNLVDDSLGTWLRDVHSGDAGLELRLPPKE